MDAIQKVFSPKERNSEAMVSFGYRLKNQFSTNETYRRVKEFEWLESLRQYKGLYDPDVRIDINNSKVYPKITRSKVNIVLSRLHEMLFPETDKNWEISPTPEPQIARETVTQIVISLIQPPQIDPATGQPAIDPATGQPSQPILPTTEDIQLAIKKYTAKTCECMSSVIDDQLIEMDYSEETKKVLRSGLMYGTGIMKGPMINQRTKRKWKPASNGEYEEMVEKEDVPFFEFVRIWDWYPDMSTTDIDNIEGSFQRHLMTKHDLRDLLKRPDFYPEIIKEHLETHSSGDYVPKAWEVDLQVIEIEAGTKTSAANIRDDISKSTNRQLGKKYQVLEFWGFVDGSDLKACGLDIPDVSLEYAANVWLLGNKPIKATLFDGALDKYKVFYYEKDETSLFGEGLARIMRHSQIAIAAAARMVLDNASCVAGPNVEVNWSLLTPGSDINSFYPRKIWYREGKGIDAQYPAVRSIEFNSHIPELLSVINAFKEFGDEETTLPTWMIGQMVNNETAQATSGRMATITISIKDVVKNFDAFTEKIIRDIYAWNMEFNSRTDIKGDYLCKARGVSSLVMKEIRMQALNQLTSTMQPEDWLYLDRRDFLKERFKAHDINITIKTEEEVQKIRDAQQQSAQMQLAIEMQKAEVTYKKAQALSQLSKAKDKNIEAIKKAQTPIEQSEGTDQRLIEGQLSLQQIDQIGKEVEIRRQEEQHLLNMQHQDETHQVEIGTKVAKTTHELANKAKMTEHTIKMGKKTAKMKGTQGGITPKTKLSVGKTKKE